MLPCLCTALNTMRCNNRTAPTGAWSGRFHCRSWLPIWQGGGPWEPISWIGTASRRGGHLWVHLMEPTPAYLVRAWLLPAAVAYGVEFYPKQDVLAPGGSGSLVRLPLGIHRKTRGWYPFLQWSAWGEWVAVPAVEEVACEEGLPGSGASRMVADEVRSACMASRKSYGSIRQWCRAQ